MNRPPDKPTAPATDTFGRRAAYWHLATERWEAFARRMRNLDPADFKERDQ